MASIAKSTKLPEYWCPQDLKTVLLNKAEPYPDITDRSQKFLDVVQKLKNLDKLELSECHYLQLLKLGLYLEEHQHYIDLRKYDMYGKRIEQWYGKFYRIYIEDFEKDHPLHNGCHLVELIDCKDISETKCVLMVKKVMSDHVVVAGYPLFCANYSPLQAFNIRFRANSFPFRCSHYALSLINFYKMTSYLFPTKIEDNDFGKILLNDRETWSNNQIAENPEQRQAVLNIVRKSSFPAPYILYGPPGTGKTATLVEAICQIYNTTTENVLVCAPSNAAVDEITKRLLKYVPSTKIIRIFSQSRDTNLIEADVKQCSNLNCYGKIIPLNDELVNPKRIVVCTLCTCTRLLFLELQIKFTYVFIDEAGQSTEPESLIAFTAISVHGGPQCQIVISGDPKQLGPGPRSKYAAPILCQSILERLMKLEVYTKHNNNNYDSRYITKLLRNYRSHPAIIHVSNELYYDNELVACKDKRVFANKQFPDQFPIVFHGVYGQEMKEKNSTSSYNKAEARKVVDYVRLLLNEKIGDKPISPQDIGIVTPFASQSNHLSRSLKAQNLGNVTVGTVEIFQGQEKEVIIVSAVRSKTFAHEKREHIGFLSNPRRFNVALTRAKAVLVVVGDPKVLQTDVNWRTFLKFCQNNNACRGEVFELKDGKDEEEDEKKCEVSMDLFGETLDILPIDDGIIRLKNKHVGSYMFSMYNADRKCCIL